MNSATAPTIMLFMTVSLLAVTPAWAQAGTAAGNESSTVSQLLLNELIAANGVPGMGAAVWRDGEIIWTGSAGVRDVERQLPVDQGTVFRLASVSKLITATAVARLAQDGQIDLDAPIATILPYLRAPWPTITARQLASHTAGLPHYQEIDGDRGGVRYPDSASAVRIFSDRALLFQPGERYSYSSWGYTLLGALIEQKAGRPFFDYAASVVTHGLAVTTDISDSGDPAASHAYEFVDHIARRAAPHDYSYTWGGGGLAATPTALAQLGGRMLRNEIVSAQTFAAMLRPATLDDGNNVEDEDYRVGLGWRTGTDRDGARIAHHAGVTSGARSTLLLWPDQDTAVSLLSNAMWVSAIEQSAQMIAAPFRPTPESLIRTNCPVDARNYAGQFGDAAVHGTINFAMINGVCTGTMALDLPIAAYVNGRPQHEVTSLRLIGIDQWGGLSRAGLVTPIGIYDLRSEGGGRFRTIFNATRQLVITISSD